MLRSKTQQKISGSVTAGFSVVQKLYTDRR
jgi:hypothetical protein